MDKGKVFRNLAKKKLAEYIQAQEQKGDQQVHTETVPTTKDKIKKVTPRKAFRINLKLVDQNKQLVGILPVAIDAVLSIGEKKKLIATVKSIENAGKTNSSDVLIQRLDNLLKKILRESGSYSIDYIDALTKVLVEVSNSPQRVGQVFPSLANAPINSAKFKNFMNQIIELLDERKQEIKDEFEVDENILPATQEEGQEEEDIELQTVGFPQAPAPASAPAVPPTPPSPRLISQIEQAKKKGKGMGMRKTKQNTYRGFTGYGDNNMVNIPSTPAIDKGFATAPMNANSPFGQPAYRSKQTNAIPKYLNFEVIPNKRGNFAVLED
jgi:hypothetical protein